MSKKIVVQNDKPKKKHGCLTCFLVTLIVFVVLVGAGTGVGCFFLDRYTKANFDMSLGQVLGVTNGLYWASDKKMVDYAYSNDDCDKFETEIKHQLFLKDDADLDLIAAVESMTENNPTENALRRAVNEATGAGDANTSGGDTSSGSGTDDGEQSSANKVFDFIAGLYTDENVDRERLAAYTDDKYSEYTFRLNDRQLAAFAANLLDALAEKQSNLKEICTQLHLDKLSDGIALRQIKFTRENRAVRLDGEVGETKEVSVLRATVQVKVLDISERMTEGISNGFVRGLARWGIRTLLPNNIYATVGFGMTDNIGLDLTINRLSGEKMENAYKLLDGIMKVTSSNGSEETAGIKDNLNKFADETLAPMFEKVNGTIDFAAVENGTVTFDTFGTLANMASKDSEETLTGQELLGTFSRLVSSECPSVEPKYDFRGWYVDSDGHKTYRPASTDGLTAVDWEEAFLAQMRDKYCLKETHADGSKVTFAEVVEVLTDEAHEGLIQYIDATAFAADATDLTKNRTLILNDKMTAAIVNCVLGSDNATVDKARIELVNGHGILDMRLTVDPLALLGSSDGMAKLAVQFLPKEIAVTVRVDVSDLPEEQLLPTEIKYNSLDASQTDDAFAVLGKLGLAIGDDFATMANESVRETFGTLRTKYGLTFVANSSDKTAIGNEDIADDAVDMNLGGMYNSILNGLGIYVS